MDMESVIEGPVDALSRALYLAITAETDSQIERSDHLVAQLASGMTEDQVEAARAIAARKAGL